MDIPTGISIVVLLVSILNYFHTRQLMIVNSVSSRRIEWIHEVRIVVSEFVTACLCGDKDTALAKKIYLELFLNPSNNEHKNLLKEINNCINSNNIADDAKAVVEEAQIMLNKSWRRLKYESGVTRRFEKYRDKQVK